MTQYDRIFDLKLRVGNSELYFMVKFLFSLLINFWCTNIIALDNDSFWPDFLSETNSRSNRYVFHDFAFYLEDYLIQEQDSLG